MSQRNRYQTEIISLRVLFFYIIRRWKFVLCFFLIGLILGSGFYVWQYRKNSSENVEKRFAQIIEDQSGTEKIDVSKVIRYKNLMEAFENLPSTASKFRKDEITNNLKELEESLTELEKQYYEFYYTDTRPSPPSIKWVAAAVLGLTAAAVMILVFRFLSDNTIKTENELNFLFNANTYARIRATDKKAKGIGRLIQKWEEKKNLPPNDEEYLLSVLRNMDCDKGLFFGDRNDTDINRLITLAEENVPGFDGSGRVSQESEALKKVRESDTVIMAVRLWKTGRSELERELEVINGMGKTIKGCVVIC